MKKISLLILFSSIWITLSAKDVYMSAVYSNSGSINTLKLSTFGLEHEIEIETEIDGKVVGSKLADLNGDGCSELYLFIVSAGSGSYGSVMAWGFNSTKSITPIYMPPLTQKQMKQFGYMGHDSFSIEGKYIKREFPSYAKNDTNAKPTNAKVVLYYTLEKGEASYLLSYVKGKK